LIKPTNFDDTYYEGASEGTLVNALIPEEAAFVQDGPANRVSV
jgi:hypothetical protein